MFKKQSMDLSHLQKFYEHFDYVTFPIENFLTMQTFFF